MYTYAFLAHSAASLVLPEGILGSLELVHSGAMAALTEPDLTLDTLQTDDQRLMQAVLWHDRVIQDLFAQITVLPLRFGTYFISRQTLEAHLASHADRYLQQLAALEGKAEYALKLTPIVLPHESVDGSVKGRDYFLAKKQIIQQQEEWQRQQNQEIEQLWDKITQNFTQVVRSKSKESIERIYILSDRQSEQKLEDLINSFQPLMSHWQISLGEMLPPYHFVGE